MPAPWLGFGRRIWASGSHPVGSDQPDLQLTETKNHGGTKGLLSDLWRVTMSSLLIRIWPQVHSLEFFFFSKLISFYNHSLSSGITRRKELKCGWYFWWRCSTLWLSHCQNDVCTWCCFCTLETASQNLDESKGFEWCWGWAMKLEKITNIALWDWMF